MLSKTIKPKFKITQLIRKNFSKKGSVRNKARLTKRKQSKGGSSSLQKKELTLLEKMELLENHLKQEPYNLEMIDVPDDGNCFLYAILKTVGSHETAQELRASLVKIINDNRDNLMSPPEDAGDNFKWSEIPYIEMGNNKDFFDYGFDGWLNEMKNDTFWCEENMMLAASIKYGRPIITINENGVTNTVSPPKHWELKIDMDNPIYLGYIQNLHYLATMRKDDWELVRVPSSPKKWDMIPDLDDIINEAAKSKRGSRKRRGGSRYIRKHITKRKI